MGLKKLLASSLAIPAIIVSVPCFAQIAAENMVVGDLYIGQSYSDVMFLYDRPSGELKYPGGSGRVFSFREKNGSEFNVRFIDDKLAGVELFGKNSLSTKAGIRIGSPVKRIRKAYGEPDEQRGTGKNGIVCYKHDAGNDHTWFLVFDVRGGKVTGIELKDVVLNEGEE